MSETSVSNSGEEAAKSSVLPLTVIDGENLILDIDPLEELLREAGISTVDSLAYPTKNEIHFLRKNKEVTTDSVEEKISKKINILSEYVDRMKYMLNEISLNSDQD